VLAFAMFTRLSVIAASLFGAMLLAACGNDGGPASTPTAEPPPPQTATPVPPTPFPTLTPVPVLRGGSAIIVGGDVRVRSEPNTSSEIVRELPDLTPVTIHRAVSGENWLVGSQTWLNHVPPWTTTWYEIEDGSFIYAGFVFVLQEGQYSPLTEVEDGIERWIDVNVTTQTASAMVGDRAVHTAAVSTGSPQFPTPLGSHRIERDGRLAVERMTSSQAGFSPSQTQYDVERVLFTQYFDTSGNALHLNYWRPLDVFGRSATSHGCVGMQLHDAQYFWLFAERGMRVEIHT
jgi:lipoprotein-anchoring transpeptidase ErfK/SrfK